MVGPPVLVAVLGASYLASAVNLLTAPGAKVTLPIHTKNGDLIFKADAYTYDPGQGKIIAVKPKVWEPNGKLAFEAELLRVDNLYNSAAPIKVDASGVKAYLRRDKDGSLPQLKYLPEPKPTATPTAFSVVVHGASVQVDDFSWKGPYTLNATTTFVQVDGLGEDWVANAPVQVTSVGKANLALVGRKGGEVTADLNNADLTLAELWQHIKTMPELAKQTEAQKWSATSLGFKGEAKVSYQAKKGLNFEADHAQITGTGLVRGGDLIASNAEFNGQLTDQDADGKLLVWSPYRVEAEGSVDWSGKQPTSDLAFSFEAGNKQSVPKLLRDLLPPDANFQSMAGKGRLALGSKQWLASNVSAQNLTYKGNTIAAVSGLASVAANEVALRAVKGSWNSTPVTAGLDIRNKSLSGFVNASRLDLGSVQQLKALGLSGNAQVGIKLAGTTDKPLISYRAKGDATYTKLKSPIQGKFQACGTADAKTFQIESATLEPSRGGLLAGNGSVNLASGIINGQVRAVGLQLGTLNPDLSGVTSAVAILGGTLKAPIATGQLELYEPAYGDTEISVATSRFSVDRTGLKFDNLVAQKGAGKVTGAASLQWKDLKLSGLLAADGLDLGLLLTNADVSGVLGAKRIVLGGTLDHPVATADVFGSQLVAQDFSVSSLQASAKWDGDVLKFSRGHALTAGTGSLDFQGQYNPGKARGAVSFSAKDLLVGPQLHDKIKDITFAGQFSGNGRAEFGNQLENLSATGSVDHLFVNENPVGGGDFQLGYKNKVWSGTAVVGDLEQYVALNSFAYDSGRNTVQAQAEASGINLGNLYKIFGQNLASVSDPVKQKLAVLNGKLAAKVAISGSTSNPNIQLTQGTVANLEFDHTPLGNLKGDFTKNGDLYTFGSLEQSTGGLEWQLGTSAGAVRGTAVRDGEIHLEGDVTHFPAHLLGILEPKMANIEGDTTISFTAKGRTVEPDVQASIEASKFGPQGSNDFSLESVLTVNKKEGIKADGTLNYKGILANLNIGAPFNYPFEIPTDKPISATLTLQPRLIRSLTDFLPGLDPAHTEGTVSGQVALNGTINGLEPSGHVSVEKGLLAWTNSSLAVPLEARADFSPKQARLVAESNSKSGSARADVAASIDDLGSLLGSLSTGTDKLYSLPLGGTLAFKDYKIDQSSPFFGAVSTQTSGDIDVSGTVGVPTLRGNIHVKDLSLTYAPTSVAQPSEVAPPINPQLDLLVSMENDSNVKAGIANIDFGGVASIGGTLNRLDITGGFDVTRGTLRFPGAKVTLQPQGSLAFRYKGASGVGGDQPQVRLDVNLEGQTRLVTTGQDLPERYNIDLGVTGNLLEDGGIRVTATSDPVGLDQSRILALLGQGGLVEAFSGNKQNVGLDQEKFRQTLTTFLPVALDSLTSRIATNLGLDYFTIDYNNVEQASLSFARYLNNRWYLEFRRQISQPLPGQPLYYDFRLIYKTPFKGKTFKRLNFFVGADQDRPWKVGLEYRIRF